MKALPEDQAEYYEERAAIMEYDGGLSREDAEGLAYVETIRKFRPELPQYQESEE